MKVLAIFYLGIIFLAAALFVAKPASAVPCQPDAAAQSELCNPVERPGGFDGSRTPAATNIIELATKIIFILAGFATLLPIIAVTYAGFSMVIAQGEPEAIIKAKTTLTWAVAGFVLAILSYIIVAATINLLGANAIPDPLAPPETVVQNPLETDAFLNFINRALVRFLAIASIASLLFIIASGFRYITAAGNEEQAAQAKTTLLWSIAGIVTISLSYVIIKAAGAIFGIK